MSLRTCVPPSDDSTPPSLKSKIGVTYWQMHLDGGDPTGSGDDSTSLDNFFMVFRVGVSNWYNTFLVTTTSTSSVCLLLCLLVLFLMDTVESDESESESRDRFLPRSLKGKLVAVEPDTEVGDLRLLAETLALLAVDEVDEVSQSVREHPSHWSL